MKAISMTLAQLRYLLAIVDADLNITLAAVLSAVKVTGVPMREQKLVVFGAGTAGVGIADQIHDAMMRDGATAEQVDRPVEGHRHPPDLGNVAGNGKGDAHQEKASGHLAMKEG